MCTDAGSGRARRLASRLGGQAAPDNATLADSVRFVVLCHPRGQLERVAAEIDGRAQCVVSVISGTPLSELRAVYPNTPVARVAVSVLAEVRNSPIWYAGGLAEIPAVEADVLEQFALLGSVQSLDERLVPAVIGLSGVGPAYFSLIVEAEVDAAVRLGLSAEVATEALLATMSGTAELLRKPGYDTLGLRRSVAAPGGPTSAGLAVLERAGLRAAFHDALDAVVEASRAARKDWTSKSEPYRLPRTRPGGF